MFTENKKQIFDAIAASDRIAIFRHIRMDGDCVGASKGLQRILQLTWPEKEVFLIDEDTAKYLEFMGPEDEEVADSVYESALGIVVDTASEARISNQKYKLCRELIKIDHHIPLEDYGHINWVEEERTVYSHQGLTYGGLVMGDELTAIRVMDIFTAMLDWMRLQLGAVRMVYKPIPYIYNIYRSFVAPFLFMA